MYQIYIQNTSNFSPHSAHCQLVLNKLTRDMILILKGLNVHTPTYTLIARMYTIFKDYYRMNLHCYPHAKVYRSIYSVTL